MTNEMENTRIIKLTNNFKEKIRQEIDENFSNNSEMKFWLWKTLIMAEIANRSFSLGISIEQFEKEYFDKQASVGRHFCDWGMDWVSEYYFEITNYIAAYYWPDNEKIGFSENYIPFNTFDFK